MPYRSDKGTGPERRVTGPGPQGGRVGGLLLVVSGPSGVGKSTICRELVGRIPGAFLSVSCTTRGPGRQEVDGRDYWFISRQQFEQWIKEGRFLEYAEVFGNLYGTPRQPIEQAMAEGRLVVLEIDVQGGRQVKQAFPDAVMLFVMPPEDRALQERLFGRGRDEEDVMLKRLRKAQEEIAAAKGLYEHFVVNDDLDRAVDEVVGIIEGIARYRQQAIVEKADDRGTHQ